MSASDDVRTESARGQILRAAAHQFAHRQYHQVNLDDILADAEVTKGALYFHFRSKQALAVAVVAAHMAGVRTEFAAILADGRSGFEALVDVTFMIISRDITDSVTRAGLNLMESIGRSDGSMPEDVEDWLLALVHLVERAQTEGDLRAALDPPAVARLIATLVAGLRHLSNLQDGPAYLGNLESHWLLVLPGLVEPDRLDYFDRFIRRRTAVAIKKVTVANLLA